MQQILKDALKIYELNIQLREIDTHDFKCRVEDFSDEHIIFEAREKLYSFTTDGFADCEMQDSEDKDERRSYRKQLRQLRRFLMKHDGGSRPEKTESDENWRFNQGEGR